MSYSGIPGAVTSLLFLPAPSKQGAQWLEMDELPKLLSLILQSCRIVSLLIELRALGHSV